MLKYCDLINPHQKIIILLTFYTALVFKKYVNSLYLCTQVCNYLAFKKIFFEKKTSFYNINVALNIKKQKRFKKAQKKLFLNKQSPLNSVSKYFAQLDLIFLVSFKVCRNYQNIYIFSQKLNTRNSSKQNVQIYISCKIMTFSFNISNQSVVYTYCLSRQPCHGSVLH